MTLENMVILRKKFKYLEIAIRLLVVSNCSVLHWYLSFIFDQLFQQNGVSGQTNLTLNVTKHVELEENEYGERVSTNLPKCHAQALSPQNTNPATVMFVVSNIL